MIEAVLTFGLITAVGEYILLASIPARTRLRILGSHFLRSCCHFGFAALNMWIHWGTITGSMTAVVAFVVSTLTLRIAQWHWGYISHGRYTPGITTLEIK